MATYTYASQIQKLYVAYFNRPADPAGLQYWDGVVSLQVAAGKTVDSALSAINASFGGASEYTAAFSGMTNTQIINKIYNNLFGRDAEPAGLLYWVNKLDTKAMLLTDIVSIVANSAQGADNTAITNKTNAAAAFTNALDTTAEIVGYNGSAALAAAKTWLSGITDAASYAAAVTASGALDSAVQGVVTAAGTYVLTAGAASVNEGATATFTLATTNVLAGAKFDYTISGVSAADVTGGLTGTATVGADGKATISVPVVADHLTEGAETLTVSLNNGKASASSSVADTSLTPVYSVKAGGATVDEGASATFTVTANDTTVSGPVAYTLSGVDAARVGSLTGNVTLTNGVGTITVPVSANAKTDGAATLTATVGTGSDKITVNDTSITPVLATDGPLLGTLVAGQGTVIVTQASLLANDTNSSGKALTGAVTASNATGGQLLASSNGDIVFLANSGVRTGSFEYTVAGVDSSIKGKANVLVDTAPTVTTTAITTNQDSAVTGTVTAVDAESDAVTFAFATPANGTVTAGTNGAFTYTPKAGYIGADTISVTATDSFGLATTKTIDVTVNAVPVFAVTGATATAEGSSMAFAVKLTNATAGVAHSVTVAQTFAGGATAADIGAATLDAAAIAAGVTFVGGVLTFPSNSTVSTATISYPVVADAVSPEAGEGVTVTLSAPTGGAGAKLATTAAATTSITDVPVTYTLTADKTSIYEGNTVVYTLQAYNGTTKVNVGADTAVSFKVVPGSTTAGDQGTNSTNLNDFAQGQFNPTSTTIAAGAGSTTYSVIAGQDSVVELPEDYKVVATIGGVDVATLTSSLLDGGSANGGQTFTLTTSPDTVGGSAGMKGSASTTSNAGDDTIKGTIDTAGTWTKLDAIDGGAGADTFAITAITAFAVPSGATVTGVESVTIVGADTVGTVAAPVDVSTAFSGVTSLKVTGGTELGLTVPSTAAVTVSGINGTANGAKIVGGASQTVTLASQDGALNLSKASAAVSVTSAAQNANTITIDNGTDVTVTAGMSATTATTQGAIGIGATTKPTGVISVTNTVSNAAGADSTGSAITIAGGSTVTVTQTASQAVATTAGANNTLTQGKVVVNGADKITSVTVSQSAAASAANTVLAVAGVTEVNALTFKALTAGDTMIINGLTFTAGAAGTTAAETAFAFANLDNGARQGYSTKGTYSGTWTASTFTSASNSTDTVTFTGTAAGARTDLADTGTGTDPTVVVSPDGVTAVSAAGRGAVVQGVVEIDDAGSETDTLTTVSVTGYATSSFVKSDALTSLTLAKNTASASLAVHNNTATTLGLTLDTLATGSTINLDAAAAKYTTLNINATGGNSTAAVTGAAVTALTVDGTKSVNMTSSSFGALQTVTVKGSAGVTLDASGANVTAVDTTATTGTNTITVDATKAKYTGGAGVDVVTLSAAAPSKNVNLGGGNDTLVLAAGTTAATGVLSGGDGTDTLKMNMADAVTASAASSFQNAFDAFEKLSIVQAAAGAAGTVDVANMDNINYVINSQIATVAGVKEVFKVTLGGAPVNGDTFIFDGVTYTYADATPTLAELITGVAGTTFTNWDVTTSDATSVTFTNKATGTKTDAVSGDFTGTYAGTKTIAVSTQGVTAVTASGLLTVSNLASGGTIELTAGGPGATVAVKDASTGTTDSLNVVLSSTVGIAAGTVTAANVESISINADDTATTATGIGDTLTLVATKATSLTIIGDANLNLTNTGNTALTKIDASGMTGTLTVVAAGTVAETITGGSGNDNLTASSVKDVLSGGAGADTLTAGSGLATLTGGAGFDTFVIQTLSTDLNSYATITDATKGDYIAFNNTGTVGFVQSQIALDTTAVFQDYANAAINNSTHGKVSWFQYLGNTYIVQEGNSEHSAFDATKDYVVKLTGLVDLSLASFDSAAVEVRIG